MHLQQQQLELDMEQQTGSKSGKEYIKSVYCHHAYLIYMQSTSCKMLDEDGINIAGRNINNLGYTDDTILMAENEEKLKSLLMRESQKTGLKLSIQKVIIMASGPIVSWQIDGEIIEIVTDFIFLGSKITADSDCSHEIKMLTVWKESYDKPRQHVKKQTRHFGDKGVCSQSYSFSSSHV